MVWEKTFINKINTGDEGYQSKGEDTGMDYCYVYYLIGIVMFKRLMLFSSSYCFSLQKCVLCGYFGTENVRLRMHKRNYI